MRTLRLSVGVAGTLVLGAASVGAVTAQDGAEPEYAAVSGSCGALGSTITGPALIEETGSVPYAYAEGYDAEVSCTMNDPRLSGRLITTQNYIQLAPGLDGGYLRAVRTLLLNDGGTWLIDAQGFTQPGTSAYTGNTYWNLYTGQGGYEGLSAVAVMLPSGMGSWDVEGVIFPGPMPEAPGYPEPPAE